MSFSEVHREFVRLGLVSDLKYRASTKRILDGLVREGAL